MQGSALGFAAVFVCGLAIAPLLVDPEPVTFQEVQGAVAIVLDAGPTCNHGDVGPQHPGGRDPACGRDNQVALAQAR